MACQIRQSEESMTNKKLQTVHVITNHMSRQLDAIFIKINSVLISISNNINNTLGDLADNLIKDFTSFDKMLNVSLVKMNRDGNLGIDKQIKELQNLLKQMKTKVFYVRIYVEEGDKASLKVVAKDYMEDIKKFRAILEELK